MGTVPGSYASPDDLVDASAEPAAAADLTPAPFESQTQPPLITWGVLGNPALAHESLYITLNDVMQLSVWNSNSLLTSVTAQLRILQPNGQILTEQISLEGLTSDRTANVRTLQLSEGMLIGALIGPAAVTNSRGQTYCTLTLLRNVGVTPLYAEQLIGDYLTSGFNPTWPEGTVKAPSEGAGYVYTVVDSGWSPDERVLVTQPAHTRWRVISISQLLTTSVQAGSRVVELVVAPGAWDVVAVADQGPSLENLYNFAPSLPWESGTTGIIAGQMVPLPPGFITVGGTTFTIQAQNMQSNDVFGQTNILVEEWVDP